MIPSAGVPHDEDGLLSRAFHALGRDLLPDLVDSAGNAVLSPTSIGIALAMARDLAGAATRAQMSATLHLGDADGTRVAPPLLGGLARWLPVPETAEGVRLALATALALTRAGGGVDPACRARLREAWGAAIVSDATLDSVNAWACRHTVGLVPSILDRLDPLAVGVILAAIHLEAGWLHPFDADKTIDRPFTLASGECVPVPTMQREGAYATLPGPGLRAVRLPYADPDLAMVVLLPDAPSGFARLGARPNGAERLARISARLDGEAEVRLLAELGAIEPRRLRLSVPRFALATQADLVTALRRHGLTLPFSIEADFSGLYGGRRPELPVVVGEVQHRATIEVAENGTRAAAVTAVAIARSAAEPLSPETFAIDRPFLFLVGDRATGAVLFRGQVGDPRASDARGAQQTSP